MLERIGQVVRWVAPKASRMAPPLALGPGRARKFTPDRRGTGPPPRVSHC